MPPIARRHRRRRHVSRIGVLAVVAVLVALVALVVLVGGLLDVRAQSLSYERSIDRSYAAQARIFVRASNRLDERFHALLGEMAGEHREQLEVALDTLARSSAAIAADAVTAASPAPSGGAATGVSAAMADRATAMRALRTAVDRLLGIAPLPAVGSPDPAGTAVTARPLSPVGAAAAFTKVGDLLAAGDRSYATGRRALHDAPGRAVLPASVWSGRTAAWSSSGTVALADALVRSSTLAAVRRVEIVTHALVLTPAPVPSAGPASARGGASLLPPTGRVRVSVVVKNAGDVAERGILVQASVAGSSGAPRASKPRHLALTADSSASITLPAIPVVPDRSYTVLVTVTPPLANAPGAVTSDRFSVRVAPPAPPTVTQLAPAKGPEKGGTDVTIFGSGFTWVSAVRFGTAPARFKVVPNSQITQITATAPPGTGSVFVTVTNPGGTAATTPADRYRYGRT